MSGDDLRDLIQYDIDNKIITFAELAREIGRSQTSISLWFRKKATWDVSRLESRLRGYYRAKTLSVRDQIRMDRIEELLKDADNRKALIEAITARTRDEGG